MAKEDKQLQSVGASGLPAERLKSKRGIHDMDQEDRVIPRLKIMQALSPEIKDKLGEEGDLLNSLTKENYGKTIAIVPVFWGKSRILWRDRKEGGGIICRADDGKNGTQYDDCVACNNSKWSKDSKTKENLPPECSAIINIISLIVRANKKPELIAVSFLKTNYNTGKQLINVMTYKNADIFNYAYDLFTESTTNEMGTFSILRYRDLNKTTNEKA